MSPEFSEATRSKLESVVGRYPQKRAALLPVLHLVQNEFGRISPVEEKMVAELLEIRPIEVREVVTFYTMFKRKEMGRHHIQICSNLSCSLLGAGPLLDHLREKLGIGPGETTEDRQFSLSTVECLGACEEAPCMMINFDYYGNLDPRKIDQILDQLK